MNYVTDMLYHCRDEKYRNFTTGLIPNINKDTVLGVKIPELRKIAKEIVRKERAKEFLEELPHQYYEENQIHSFIIDYGKYSFEETIRLTEVFLPYIDNWAVCDSFKPGVLKKNAKQLLPYIEKWLKSDRTYTIRYAYVLLLNWYLDDNFDKDILEKAATVKSGEYYVRTAEAWFFSMALVKQYDCTIIYLEEKILDPDVHKKTIQKAIESRQIDNRTKEYLRTLK